MHVQSTNIELLHTGLDFYKILFKLKFCPSLVKISTFSCESFVNLFN